MYQGLHMKKILCAFFTLLMSFQLQGGNIDWSSPQTVLSNSSFNASDAQVAIDTNGDVVVVWSENNFVKAKTKHVGNSWSSAVTLSATGASAPKVVSDSNGNATAIWVEGGIIKAATKTLNGNWSSAVTLSNSGASAPSLCVDSAGDVIAAWARNGGIETSTKLFGGSWQAKNSLTGNSAISPCIAIGGSGSNTRAVIIWQGVSGGINTVYAATKLISGSWSSVKIVSDPDKDAVRPHVAVDSNGNATAVWYSYDIVGLNYTNVLVSAAERDPVSGNWGTIYSLSQPGLRNPSTLSARVAYDGVGNAIALWNISFDDETFNIQSAVKPANSNWSQPVDLVGSNLYAYAAELSPTSIGDVLSLYMFYNGNAFQIQSIESDINGFLNNSWTVPVTISSGVKNAYPKIAASLNGNVINAAAVWINYDGAHTVVAASNGSKTLILPPSNLAVTQSVNNFGIFNEYYNTLTWTASSDPSVVGYLVFRNGVFLQQVGADVLQYVDDNRTQNGSVKYSVTAVDSQQTQSTTVSVSFP